MPSKQMKGTASLQNQCWALLLLFHTKHNWPSDTWTIQLLTSLDITRHVVAFSLPLPLTDGETKRFSGSVRCPQLLGWGLTWMSDPRCLAENYLLPCKSRNSTQLRLKIECLLVACRTALTTLCLSALCFQLSWAAKTLCPNCRLQALEWKQGLVC